MWPRQTTEKKNTNNNNKKNTNHTDWFTAASQASGLLHGVVSKSSCSQQSDHVNVTDRLHSSCSGKLLSESSRLKISLTSANHRCVAFVRLVHTLSTFMRRRSSYYMYIRRVYHQVVVVWAVKANKQHTAVRDQLTTNKADILRQIMIFSRLYKRV